MHTTRSLLSAVALAAAATAQAPPIPALPHVRTFDMLVGDQNFDGVYRLVDWNQDGDYDDAGEVIVYYDSAIGSVPLGTPSGIAQLANGTALVCDVTSDVIVALRDQNGDGDANDPGENWVYFDNANASGIGMYSMQGLCVDLLDRVFVANGDNGQGGTDGIFLLEDLDQDGDCNDAGEVRSYFDIATTSTGHSNPFDVMVGPDNNLYYTDNGINGPITKGVYRLVDSNLDGDCNDPGEANLFWAAIPTTLTPFLGDVKIDQAGRFYVADYGTRQLYQLIDTNFDGVIDSSSVFFSQTTSAIWYDVSVRDDGAVLLSDYATPGTVRTMFDADGSGTIDPSETALAYDAAVAASPLARPRSMSLMRGPVLEMSPPVVQIGNVTNCLVRTEQAFDLAAVFLSAAVAAPFPLPPWGNGEVDPFSLAVLGFGLADANAQYVLPFAIPNNPSVVATYGLQVWSGHDFHPFLSNASALVVTP